jgi:hypothetical protein
MLKNAKIIHIPIRKRKGIAIYQSGNENAMYD